ncbi:MAG: HdeD family acid-resistance protein, partial [Hyphomicrobiales bacterium]|nr:HdeD family acid-resistance protein [Hyphomicrobiales bacterium]
MTNASGALGNPQVGSDTAPLRAKSGWIIALGVVYLLAGIVALGSVAMATVVSVLVVGVM